MMLMIRFFFILSAIMVASAVCGSLVIMKTYHLTFFELVNKSALKLGVIDAGSRLIEYEKKYTAHIVTLRQTATFPKILPSVSDSSASYYEDLRANLKALGDNGNYIPDCSKNDIRNLFYCYLLGEVEKQK